jgi:hypothetical protein
MRCEKSYFERDWEAGINREIPEYEKLAGDATRELGLRAGDNKLLRARYVAQQLTKGERRFVPPTMERIIRGAIDVKLAGTCLKTRPAAAKRP